MTRFLVQSTGLLINLSGNYDFKQLNQYIDQMFDKEEVYQAYRIDENQQLMCYQYQIERSSVTDFIYCEVGDNEALFKQNAQKFFDNYYLTMNKVKQFYEVSDFKLTDQQILEHQAEFLKETGKKRKQ